MAGSERAEIKTQGSKEPSPRRSRSPSLKRSSKKETKPEDEEDVVEEEEAPIRGVVVAPAVSRVPAPTSAVANPAIKLPSYKCGDCGAKFNPALNDKGKPIWTCRDCGCHTSSKLPGPG